MSKLNIETDMSTISIKLKNSDQKVLIDQEVYNWLSTDPEMVKCKVLDYLYLHDSMRIHFNRTRVKREQIGAKRSFYLQNKIAEKFLQKPAATEEANLIVGFINGDYLDCRLENLTYQVWGVAKRKSASNCKTGYKGVHPAGNRYKAVIYVNGRYQHLGYFSTARQAAICFNHHATELFGDQCRLNTIPDTDPEEEKLSITKYARKDRAKYKGAAFAVQAGKQ